MSPSRRYVLDARTATNHFPGIGRYVTSLASAMLPQLQDELLVLLQESRSPSLFEGPFDRHKVEVVTVDATPFGAQQQFRIPPILHKLADQWPVVYHSPYYLMPYQPGVPTVVTVHDLIPMLLPTTVSARARLLFRFTMRMALAAAQKVVCVSQATAADLQQWFDIDAGKVTVIHHAPDPRFCPQSLEQTEMARQRLGIPGRYLLYVGINKPHKNLVELVEAFALAGDRSLTLVIAGAWDDRYPEVKEVVSRLKLEESVLLAGRVSEDLLPGLMAGATGFVFPSLYEGFGLPVVEAMACGTPVACSRVSSLPEVGGDAVLYFDPADRRQIATAILRLGNDEDLRRQLRQKGLARAATMTWSHAARQTLELYRSIPPIR